MAVATMSTKGQIVIPAGIRHQAGLRAGDQVAVENGEDGSIILQRVLTWEEMSAKYSAWVKPGVEPLESASDFYATRSVEGV